MSQLCLLRTGSSSQGLQATQDWKFATNKTLSSSKGVPFAYSRASGGGYSNSSGLYKWSGVNYLPYSEDYANAWWTKSLMTVASDFAVAPDGVSYADKIIPTAANGWHSISRTSGLSWNGVYSVYLKADGYGFAGIELVNGFLAVINLTTGAVESNNLAGSTISTENVGNGWWRVSYFYASSSRVILYPFPTSTAAQITGDGTSGILVWGMMVNSGGATVATHYAPTEAVASTNDARFDYRYVSGTLQSFGILNEEQRINYCTYSEDFGNAIWSKGGATVSSNAAASPAGYWTADALVETSATSTHYFRQDLGSFTTGQVINYSVYVKAGIRSQVYIEFDNSGAFFSQAYAVVFDLTNGSVVSTSGPSFIAGQTYAEFCGNGWYRVGFAVAAPGNGFVRVGIFGYSGGITGYTGTNGATALYAWGAQVEVGNERTSYIPNLVSGSTTRSADIVNISGANFTGFWNATEGSVSIEFSSLGAASLGASKRLFMFRDSGGTNRLNCELGTSTVNFESTPAGANLLASRNTGVLTFDRFSARYKVNDFAASLDGGAVYTDTTVAMPTGIDRLDIGNFNGSSISNCHISRFRYFNTALTDKQLEDLGRPSLSRVVDFQFASTKSLTPTVGPSGSFSRASSKWYTNSSGVLTQAAINEAAFDHAYNPVTGRWDSVGFIPEDQRTNQAMYSGQIDNAWWPKYRATITSDLVEAPDGTITADKIVEDNTNSYRGVTGYRSGLSVTAGVRYTFSIYLKAAERSWALIALGDGARFGDCSVNFDLANGAIGTYNQGTASPAMTAAITPVGNGWYRCQINATCLSTSATSVAIGVQLCNGDNVAVYTGDNASGIYAWGGQFEAGVSASSYIPTTTGSVTRSADVFQLTGTAFSGIWNPFECTVISEYGRELPVNAGASPFSLFGSSEASDLIYIAPNGGNETCYTYVGNVAQCALAAGASPTSGQTSKVAFAIRANNFGASKGGAATVTDASGTVTTCTQMKIGYANSNWINRPIKSLTIYSVRLSDRWLVQNSA